MGLFLLRLISNGAAVAVAAFLIPGIELRGWLTFLVVGFVFGLVNATIKPVALILTCLINIFTLGLFTLVINAVMFLLTAWLTGVIANVTNLDLHFQVAGFGPAFFGALVASIVSFLLTRFLGTDQDDS